ncbi:hypothetical protein BGZ89_006240, partial [Linnemannia elongata]
MSSSSPQCRSSSPPPAPSSAFPRHREIPVDGQRVISQLENTTTIERVSLKSGDIPTIVQGLANIHIGPANLLSPLGHRTTKDAVVDVDHGPSDATDVKSVNSARPSKFGFRKRLSRLFKGHPKVKDPVPASAASSAPITLAETGEPVQSAAPDRKAVLDVRSVSSGRPSKFGFRKRLSRLFKGHPKVKDPVPASAASSAPITLAETGEPVQSVAPDRKAVLDV